VKFIVRAVDRREQTTGVGSGVLAPVVSFLDTDAVPAQALKVALTLLALPT